MNKKINIEYIGAGLYEAFVEGCDSRGVGCTEIEAINSLLQYDDIRISEDIAIIEYIGYGLYEAKKDDMDVRVVSTDKTNAVRELYSLLIDVA